jgi:arylsulfatase A-like enzyme
MKKLMMRTLTICLAAGMLSAAAAVVSAVPALAADGPRNVILIGWDGAQRAHVHECLGRGELPTLKKLGEEGGLVDIDVVNGATDTKAGWSQILTGYNPEVTGVYSNGKYRDIPKGLSVFERLEEHFGADKFVTVAVIGKSAHCGEIRPPSKVRLDGNAPAEGDQPAAKKAAKKAAAGNKQAKQPGAGKQATGAIVEENGVKYRVFGGSPYYTMHKSCDVWEYGLVQDEKVGSRALELLDKYKDKPFFFFVHFAEVDHSGHKAGENSKEYNDALISGDTWTGKIIEKLKQLGLYDKTTVYVTADHGFNEGANGHPYAPYVFLGTNDARVKRAGMRQDITPTVLERFGLDLGKFEPKLDGESLAVPAVKPVLKAPENKAGAPLGGLRPAARKKKAA